MSPIPEPKIPPSEFDPKTDKIRFRFHYTRKKKSYSCSKIKDKDLKVIARKLHEYQKMSVLQFKASNGVNFKNYRGKNLPKVPEELSLDVADQLADYFRINNKIRIYGFLFDQNFEIIWIDPDHKISDRKN